MRLEHLEAEHFRNYQALRADFDPQCNVILGENAQGKTNLLEAIFYLSCGRSPRTRTDRELISFGAEGAMMKAGVFAWQRPFTVEARLAHGRRRRLLVNGVPAKSAGEFSRVYHTVFFSPEDLGLVRQGAALRRRFLDTALCQLRPRYAAALAGYQRSYEQKTRILRDWDGHPDFLAALPEFNAQMVRYGAVLIKTRARFARRLQEYAAAVHRDCSGGREELEIAYTTVSAVEDPLNQSEEEIQRALEAHMAAHQGAEHAARLCLSGPHKDDLAISINGREAKTFASQGQTRTAALSLKLAEREIFADAAGEYPVLLLDDVLSELDPKRQEFVLNRIAGGQVFITCCEDDRLPALLGGKVLRVRQGELA